MGSIDFRLATVTDDPDLRRLLRENPMQGEISVSLEREPDLFMAGSIEGERHDTIVVQTVDIFKDISCHGSHDL